MANPLSDFFMGGKPSYSVAVDPYKSTRESLTKWLDSQIGQNAPAYGGEKVAPLSPYENQSFDFLRQYGDSGYGSTFQGAKNEINKTLSGGYDPSSSPYYQAVKAGADRNLAETQKNIASNAAGGGGRYWTGARLKEQDNAATDTNIGLNQMLGGMRSEEHTAELH